MSRTQSSALHATPPPRDRPSSIPSHRFPVRPPLPPLHVPVHVDTSTREVHRASPIDRCDKPRRPAPSTAPLPPPAAVFPARPAQNPHPLCLAAPPDSLPSFFPQSLVHRHSCRRYQYLRHIPYSPDRLCICDQAVPWMPLLSRKLDRPAGFLAGPSIAPDQDGLALPATSAPSLPVEKWEHSAKYFLSRKTFCPLLSSSVSEPRLCEWSQGACASRGAL